ncbi:MAG TPA: formylmethanofuran--tetrahydromethanopterin N-formyltransferase [Vicinamibacterales bacterium]|jgi:formylmethanofuran--tetrahydromethanopterin N-formyltransferase|nr:formylmethanofuran--tetrahydromethanopterin N-formyltransferase [Vicinamibacterales bacterium]
MTESRSSQSQTGALVDDTYAEAFKSLYAEVLITARNRTWVDHAVHAATGNASSTIMCDCEAGLDGYTDTTPDGRPGAIVQFHVPRFRKDRVEALERSLLVRISQNVLTCPTAACFNLLDTDPYYKLGRKVAYFGNGYQFRDTRHGRRVWVVPILGGEFVIDRRFGYSEGLMGGNLWLMASDVDSALAAAERATTAIARSAGVITPFPGGVAASGSKIGSRYSFSIASTYEKYCPTLRGAPGVETALPDGVNSVMEIIVNGRNIQAIADAVQAAISAAVGTPGLIRISAGNYDGRLGKNFIYLRADKPGARDQARPGP